MNEISENTIDHTDPKHYRMFHNKKNNAAHKRFSQELRDMFDLTRYITALCGEQLGYETFIRKTDGEDFNLPDGMWRKPGEEPYLVEDEGKKGVTASGYSYALKDGTLHIPFRKKNYDGMALHSMCTVWEDHYNEIWFSRRILFDCASAYGLMPDNQGYCKLIQKRVFGNLEMFFSLPLIETKRVLIEPRISMNASPDWLLDNRSKFTFVKSSWDDVDKRTWHESVKRKMPKLEMPKKKNEEGEQTA